MPDIVISEFMDESIIRDTFGDHDVYYDPALVDRSEDLVAALTDARALIVRNRTRVHEALLEAAPHLRIVGRLGVGLDNIDVEACRVRGVAVRAATGANDVSVAEYVISATLLLIRRAWSATPEVLAGRWPRMSTIGCEVGGRTFGLIGLGAIARETARRAAALDMRVTAYDPYLADDDDAWSLAQGRDLDSLLAQADVLSLHVPLTPETRHLLSAPRIAQMRRGAIVINAARGGVVDEAALAVALRSGYLGGAALDVFEREPLDAAAAEVLSGIPNLVLTPHIAGVTEESNVRVSDAIARAVLEHLTN